MAKTKILLAEDEEVMRSMLVDFMSMFDYEIIEAENGEQAWDMWNEDNFTVVISDINMPKMSGIDLLRKIKESSPDFPVILITGVSIDTAKKMAEKYKADAFLSKPFKMKRLLMTLQDVLKK